MARARAPGRPPGHSAQYQEQRRRILDAATALFAEQGFERTGLRAIAVASGLSPGALYHYFPGKDAIMEALIEDTVRRPVEGIRGFSDQVSLGDVLFGIGLRFLEGVARTPGRQRFQVVLLAAHQRPIWATRYLEGISAPAEEALTEVIGDRLPGALRDRLDPRLLAQQFNGALISFVLHEQILRRGRATPEDRRKYVGQLVRVLTAGLDALAADPHIAHTLTPSDPA